jgi:hypothetical protein
MEAEADGCEGKELGRSERAQDVEDNLEVLDWHIWKMQPMYLTG